MREREHDTGPWSDKDKGDDVGGQLFDAGWRFCFRCVNVALKQQREKPEAKRRKEKRETRGPQTCVGSGADLGGSPARSPLSRVAVHDGASLTEPPPELHGPHLNRRQRVVSKVSNYQDVIPSPGVQRERRWHDNKATMREKSLWFTRLIRSGFQLPVIALLQQKLVKLTPDFIHNYAPITGDRPAESSSPRPGSRRDYPRNALSSVPLKHIYGHSRTESNERA